MHFTHKLIAAGLFAATFAPPALAVDYPYRDITDVVVWGAGGGTDTLNRLIMSAMADELPVSISVVNQTGGVGGSNGMIYVLNQPEDGYTLAGISESCVTAAVQGGWDKKFDIWYPFIVAGSPDVISVSKDSKYKTLQDLIDAAKANPSSITAGASAAGSIHHLNLLALENGTGAKFKFVPYNSSNAAQEATLSGEVQLVVTSLAEQQALIKGGELRPLAMLVPNSANIGDYKVASAFDSYPGLSKYLPLQQAIGFAVAASAPDDVKAELTKAFDKAMKSDKIKAWAHDNYYNLSGLSGPEASKVFAKLESNFSWTLYELGETKIDPASLGIPKP